MIVDANAFIKQINLRQVVNRTITSDEQFNSMYEVYTLQEVMNEIKDERARAFFKTLPYELKIIPTPNEKDLTKVENFAKDTGDFVGLSKVDMLVIAAGLSVSRDKGEISKVRLAPKPLSEFRPKSFKPYYSDDESNSSDEEEQKQAKPVAEDDGFEQTKGGRRALKPREVKKYVPETVVPEEEVKAEEHLSDTDALDNEEDGGEWVTSENLYSHISGGATQNLMDALDNALFTEAKVNPVDLKDF